jgi:thymidylate synthase
MFKTLTEYSKRTRRIGKNYSAVLPAISHDERQYCNLIWDIMGYGSVEKTRNGTTMSVFGAGMHFSLRGGIIPLLTTKRVAWVTCLKELLWFIRGCTDNAILKEQGVHIWDANARREFLDGRGLTHLRENDLGPVYGHQWRHFNAPYTGCDTDYSGKGVDQLASIIATLKDPAQRTSRRMVMSAWNPQQLDEMALPPCHVLVQFNVSEGDLLSCALYQRSGDVGLGVPFNIASYALLTHLLAHHCGLRAHEFIYTVGNAHIYEEHICALQLQIEREPYPFPVLEIIGGPKERIEDYIPADFVVRNYTYHPPIKMEMKA